MTKRFVSIHLPRLAIERLRRLERYRKAASGPPPAAPCPQPPQKPEMPEAPLALIGHSAKGQRLTAFNAAAQAQGLYPQMALTDALALVPALHTRPAAPQQDLAELVRLARWCRRYGMTGNHYEGDSLWIDISGTPHLFGGEAPLLAKIEADFAAQGYHVHAALADSFAAAYALSRFPIPPDESGRPRNLIPTGQALSYLAAFPIEALRLSPSTIAVLHRLGLKTIAQLQALPRAALKRRFPAATDAEAVLLRLDQLLGLREEPLASLQPPASFLVRQTFAEALLSMQQVEHSLHELLKQLLTQLEAKHAGARSLLLRLWRTDGSCAHIRIGTSSPSRNQQHLSGLLKEKLGRIEPGFGVDIITLEADNSAPLAATQTSLASAGKPQQHSPAQLLDRLGNRLGPGRLGYLHPVARHLPEKAQQWRPTPISTAGATNRTPAQASLNAPAATKNSAAPPRPFLLLHPPEAISVMAPLPDEPPLLFTWRRVTRRVASSDGPERIAAEWGHEFGIKPGRTRDYYRVQSNDGSLFWLYRDGLYCAEDAAAPRWFMHGFFC